MREWSRERNEEREEEEEEEREDEGMVHVYMCMWSEGVQINS